jgi:hypothetical protein
VVLKVFIDSKKQKDENDNAAQVPEKYRIHYTFDVGSLYY